MRSCRTWLKVTAVSLLAETPSRPKKKGRLGATRATSRCRAVPFALHPLSRLRLRSRLICYQSPQLLTGLEYRHGPSGHFHRIAGARVPRHSSFSAPNLEGTETPDLDVVLLFERFLDRFQEGV